MSSTDGRRNIRSYSVLERLHTLTSSIHLRFQQLHFSCLHIFNSSTALCKKNRKNTLRTSQILTFPAPCLVCQEDSESPCRDPGFPQALVFKMSNFFCTHIVSSLLGNVQHSWNILCTTWRKAMVQYSTPNLQLQSYYVIKENPMVYTRRGRSDLIHRQFLRCVWLLSFCTGLLRGEGSIDGRGKKHRLFLVKAVLMVIK